MPETPRTPKLHSGKVIIWGGSRVSMSPERLTTVNIDCPVPSALEWFMKALDRLKAAPDCPQEITEAARRIQREMNEAFRRRQVDALWGLGHIKNRMRSLELWKPTRSKKG